MKFNSGFKGLTVSGFTLERGGGSIVGRGPDYGQQCFYQ